MHSLAAIFMHINLFIGDARWQKDMARGSNVVPNTGITWTAFCVAWTGCKDLKRRLSSSAATADSVNSLQQAVIDLFQVSHIKVHIRSFTSLQHLHYIQSSLYYIAIETPVSPQYRMPELIQSSTAATNYEFIFYRHWQLKPQSIVSRSHDLTMSNSSMPF